MKKPRYKKIALVLISVVLVFSTVFLLYGNLYVDVEHFQVVSNKIPKSFDNYLIAHITDYHNRDSKIVDKQIVDSLKQEQPNIIVITGDLIDNDRVDVAVALNFVHKLCEIAPVYYVTGNHEANVLLEDVAVFTSLINGLEDAGVVVLRNSSVKITNAAGDSFNLFGIHDPYMYGGFSQIFPRAEALCTEFDFKEDEFNILLAHHPEMLYIYSKFDIDLVFSGHAHGGQITLFRKALLAPDQGSFPIYSEGLYNMGNTQLVLSRGIGYSSLPIRVFCNPHLVYAHIKTE